MSVVVVSINLGYAAAAWSDERAAPTQPRAITFSTDLSATLITAKEFKKPVAIVFSAVWCPNCRKFEQSTLTAPEITALGEDLLWIQIDIDRQTSIARSYDIDAVPQVLLLDSQGIVRMRVLGNATSGQLQTYTGEFFDSLHAPAPPTPVVRGEASPQTHLTWRPKGYRANSGCFSNVGYGPLRIRSQSPFQSLRLALLPRTPSTLQRHEKELQASGTWANIWAPSDGRLLDFEALQLDGSFAYGITDSWQVEVGLLSAHRFGGELDGLIQNTHDLLGVDQNRRDEVPRGEFDFRLTAPNGSAIALDDGDRGEFARAMIVTLQNNVTCGNGKMPAFAYAFTWRYELQSDDLEGGSPSDFGVSLTASRRFGKLYAYGTLGYTAFGRETFRGLALNDTQVSLMGAVEWRRWPKTSLILQYLWTEEAVDDLKDFSQPSNELILGWKKEVGSGTVLEAGVIENIITNDNSPDFGLHFGVGHRF